MHGHYDGLVGSYFFFNSSFIYNTEMKLYNISTYLYFRNLGTFVKPSTKLRSEPEI